MKAIFTIVRNELPGASDELCKKIIQQTNYPLGGLERFEHQVKEAAIEYRREKAMK